MGSTSSRLLRVVGVLMAASTLSAQTPALPAAIRASLDESHPGWAIVPPHNTGTANVASGDFDGDGAPDYAAFIVYPASEAVPGGAPMGRVIAFLKTGSGYRTVPVSRPLDASKGARIHIQTLGKGTKQYDLNTNRPFVLERDGIRVSPLSSGPCNTFVYRDGVFVGTWTCD